MRCKGGYIFWREATEESTKNGLSGDGATELGDVVFSRVRFDLRDLDSGRGAMAATTQLMIFPSSGSASVSGLWLPPYLVVSRRPSGHG